MFKWLFHVVDDNYKERPHKFTDEEIKEFMSRYDIDNEELKELIEDLLEYENYYIKEGELFLKDKNNGKEAPFTFRISNDTEQEVIGGEDKYIALSRISFKSFVQKFIENKEY